MTRPKIHKSVDVTGTSKAGMKTIENRSSSKVIHRRLTVGELTGVVHSLGRVADLKYSVWVMGAHTKPQSSRDRDE